MVLLLKSSDLYDYKDVRNTGNDVFRRHSNCACVVIYDPQDGSGTVQNAHIKETFKKTISSVEDINTIEPYAIAWNKLINKGLNSNIIATNGTKEYQRNASVHNEIIYSKNYNKKKNKTEIAFSNWLKDELGGRIELMNELLDKKTPDFIWNNKIWELKTLEGVGGIHKRINKAIEQIESGLNTWDKASFGGIIFDVSKNSKSVNEIIIRINKVINELDLDKLDIFIKYGENNNYCLIRYKKR